MNKIVSICLIALFAPLAHSQTVQNQQERTTLYVDVAVERQEVTAGPYARYAQKYLGVAAPLADKVICEVTSVSLLNTNDMLFRTEAKVEADDNRSSHMFPLTGFPRLTVDKTSAAAISLEESARLAAEKIFEIRRSRFDLITGEIGENVFGGGLSAALAKLDELEEEYLSLFLGKQTTGTERKQYRVAPLKGRLTYTVCRFSETDGLLPEDDLSGEPMVLELKPANDSASAAQQTSGTQARPSSRAVPVIVPAEMRCRIILDGAELASEVFVIAQLSETVYVER